MRRNGVKITMPGGKVVERHPDDSWARVELFRWQYGELPKGDDGRRLDHRVAFEKVADAVDLAVRSKDMSLMPMPFNMIAMLRYAARHLPVEATPC